MLNTRIKICIYLGNFNSLVIPWGIYKNKIKINVLKKNTWPDRNFHRLNAPGQALVTPSGNARCLLGTDSEVRESLLQVCVRMYKHLHLGTPAREGGVTPSLLVCRFEPGTNVDPEDPLPSTLLLVRR